ncbi:glucose PTS transporter subunit IIA [Actinomyces dentalis]|uniref:glucose PTS transporter subunit IIA n=1 Tax=Actinomyces dentalis TaxID=272548 RepID=UPI0028E3B1B9|nr:glucose PTS transporter subunit IIA [Actinomyces dentalis]
MATTTSTPEAILEAVGGPGNIVSFTHCATRLRFELHDASVVDKATVEKIPGVMGAVPQGGDRYQIVIGGAVASVYEQINSLPAMKAAGGASGSGGQTDADVKAAARAKARGKNALIDAFFEYLSDSFRPLLPVLLGASLIIAGEAIFEAFHLIDTHATNEQKPVALLFVDSMYRSVFYFLPIMVAYNASKKLKIDPWVGASVMAALLTPEFLALSGHAGCVPNNSLDPDLCTAHILGLPLQFNKYGGQVFVPLLMVAVLALVYKGLVKIIPNNVQMVFVSFLSFVIMMPVTAFFIGPLGVWIGNGLGTGLKLLNDTAPIIFAIIIPMVYPFLVPLGLHWPLNALMLANIAPNSPTGGKDFIQGPMGAWNFACFGATAAVLVWSVRDRDKEMRQTATGALFAGLFGGISEPSLYGIHLRFKRIYPFMLAGCAVGGIVEGLGSMLGGLSGVTTTTFVFTSLLTIPVFDPMFLYGIAVAAAFGTSFFLIVTFGYRTKEERAEALAAAGVVEADATAAPAVTAPATTDDDEPADKPAEEPKPALAPGAVTEIVAPLAGTVMPLDKVEDPVFSTGVVGQGAGISPADGKTIVVTAPAAGTLAVAPASGHAYGITLDSGVEVLIHVGLDTVNLGGKGFDVKVKQGDRVTAGQELVRVDRKTIEDAGYSLTTPVLITNTDKFASVEVIAEGEISPNAPLIRVTAPEG